MQDLNKHCCSDLHYTEITNPVHMDREGNGHLLHSLPYRRLSAGDISKSLPQLCFAIKHILGNVSLFARFDSILLTCESSYLLGRVQHQWVH